MNLGQAVAVCLYEIASRIGEMGQMCGIPIPNQRAKPQAPASTRDLDLLAGVVEQTMLAAKYSPPPCAKQTGTILISCYAGWP